MNFLFFLALRLFSCFLGAKFLLLALDLDSRSYLVGLTTLLLVNVYLFEYLVFRERFGQKEGRREADLARTPEEPRKESQPPAAS